MESVWWVFKQLSDKGLVYRGFKVRLKRVCVCLCVCCKGEGAAPVHAAAAAPARRRGRHVLR